MVPLTCQAWTRCVSLRGPPQFCLGLSSFSILGEGLRVRALRISYRGHRCMKLEGLSFEQHNGIRMACTMQTRCPAEGDGNHLGGGGKLDARDVPPSESFMARGSMTALQDLRGSLGCFQVFSMHASCSQMRGHWCSSFCCICIGPYTWYWYVKILQETGSLR